MEIWRAAKLTKTKATEPKPCPDFGLDELIRALSEQGSDTAQGYYTVSELCGKLLYSVGWVRKHLTRLMGDGKLIRGNRIITTLDGRTVRVPAYRLRAEEEKHN